MESCLVVQWLRLHTSTAGDRGLIPGQGTKILHAAWCRPRKRKKNLWCSICHLESRIYSAFTFLKPLCMDLEFLASGLWHVSCVCALFWSFNSNVINLSVVGFFFIITIIISVCVCVYVCIYLLAASGLSWGVWDLHWGMRDLLLRLAGSSLRHAGFSLVVTRGFLFFLSL